MTPLEQFNEEVMKEFKKLFISEEIAEDVPGFDPIEYDYEWSGEPIDALKFITQKLTEHKELILKMVREKFPEFTGNQNTLEHARVWQICRKKFLNNLDTI